MNETESPEVDQVNLVSILLEDLWLKEKDAEEVKE